MPVRGRDTGLAVLALLWLVLFAGSYAAAWLAEPTDTGFTRGLNRLIDWFWIQAAAFAVAIAAWFRARKPRSALSRVPVLVMALQIPALALFIAYAMLIRA